MATTVYNTCVRRGDTWVINFSFREADQTTPIDLTGRTFTLQIRATPDAEDALVSLTEGSGITVDAMAGDVSVIAQTEDLAAGIYYYDLQYVNGVIVETAIGGRLTLEQDVTRSS